jgi:hypothetical protein
VSGTVWEKRRRGEREKRRRGERENKNRFIIKFLPN